MNYRSLAQLNHDVVRNLHRVPPDVDVIVGVPRSGLMAASLVALALNLPLADLEGFVAGRLLSSGKTRRRKALDAGMGDLRHALLVDDSVWKGNAIAEARLKLADAPAHIKITTCAIYGHKDAGGLVDLMFEDVPLPRVFEWNLMHHDTLANACVDIDGVLCHDPDARENDDGAEYLNFLRNARPLHAPSKRIGALVTSRLEKYRDATEAWLAAQGIQYDELVMLDLPDAESRRRSGAHIPHKADFYRKSRHRLFIESEPHQAQQIAQRSGKPVLCVEDQILYQPDTKSASSSPARPASAARRLARQILGPRVRRVLRSALAPSR
jgi:uncharacterized HAD superfamily protein